MNRISRLPDVRALHAEHHRCINDLLDNAQELYTHINDIIVHATRNDDGSITVSKEDYDGLREACRCFSLRGEIAR